MKLLKFKRIIFVFSFAVLSSVFTSCYQAHSDDSLRTVPVTNNPNIIPNGDPYSRFTAVNP